MGSLCDQWGCWGPPAAVVGTGEAWTHSPTVWGRLMPAQTLWPVGGLPGMPFLPGWYFGHVEELRGLRRMDGPLAGMLKSHTHCSTPLHTLPILPVTFSHAVRSGWKRTMCPVQTLA